MPLGFLAVFSEPGSQVSLEEFQDWYNNEHVPLRMNDLPSFLTGARFSAADSKRPGWLALYDIDDTLTFQHESYTRLRANRSPREANLVVRLELLDRRTCELLSDSGVSPKTTSLASANPTKIIVTHGVNLSPGQTIGDWVESAIAKLRQTSGWLRTRTFMCIDNLKTGTSIAGEGPEEQGVPRYFTFHELESSSDANSFEFTSVVASREGVEVVEYRSWNLYRAYPGIVQGNIQQ